MLLRPRFMLRREKLVASPFHAPRFTLQRDSGMLLEAEEQMGAEVMRFEMAVARVTDFGEENIGINR